MHKHIHLMFLGLFTVGLLIHSHELSAGGFKLVESHWHHVYSGDSTGLVHSRLKRDVHRKETVINAVRRIRKINVSFDSSRVSSGEIVELYEFLWNGVGKSETDVLELLICTGSVDQTFDDDLIRVERVEALLAGESGSQCSKVYLLAEAGKTSLSLRSTSVAKLGFIDSNGKIFWMDEGKFSNEKESVTVDDFDSQNFKGKLNIKYDRWIGKSDIEMKVESLAEGNRQQSMLGSGSGGYGDDDDSDRKHGKSPAPTSMLSTILIWFNGSRQNENSDPSAFMLSSLLPEAVQNTFRIQLVTDDGHVYIADLSKEDLDKALRIAPFQSPDYWQDLLTGITAVEDIQSAYLNWMFYQGGETVLREEFEARVDELVRTLAGGSVDIQLPAKLTTALGIHSPAGDPPGTFVDMRLPEKLIRALGVHSPVGDPPGTFEEPVDMLRVRRQGQHGSIYGEEARGQRERAERSRQLRQQKLGRGLEGNGNGEGHRPPESHERAVPSGNQQSRLSEYGRAFIAAELRSFQGQSESELAESVQNFLMHYFSNFISQPMLSGVRALFEEGGGQNRISKRLNIRKNSMKYYIMNLILSGRAVRLAEKLVSFINIQSIIQRIGSTQSPHLAQFIETPVPFRSAEWFVEGASIDSSVIEHLGSELPLAFWSSLSDTLDSDNENSLVTISYVSQNNSHQHARLTLLDSSDSGGVTDVVSAGHLWQALVPSAVGMLDFQGELLRTLIKSLGLKQNVALLMEKLLRAGFFNQLCGFDCTPALASKGRGVQIQIQKNEDGTVQVSIQLQVVDLSSRGRLRATVPVDMSLSVELFFDASGHRHEITGRRIRIIKAPDSDALAYLNQLMKLEGLNPSAANRSLLEAALGSSYRADYNRLSPENQLRERSENRTFLMVYEHLMAANKNLNQMVGEILESQGYRLSHGRYAGSFSSIFSNIRPTLDLLETLLRYHQEVEETTYWDLNRSLVRRANGINQYTWPTVLLRRAVIGLRKKIENYRKRLRQGKYWAKRQLASQCEASRELLLEVQRLRDEYLRLSSTIGRDYNSDSPEHKNLQALIKPLEIELSFSEVVARIWHLQALHQTYIERREVHNAFIGKYGTTYLRLNPYEDVEDRQRGTEATAITARYIPVPGGSGGAAQLTAYNSLSQPTADNDPFVVIDSPGALSQPVAAGSGQEVSFEDFLSEDQMTTPVDTRTASRTETTHLPHSAPTGTALPYYPLDAEGPPPAYEPRQVEEQQEREAIMRRTSLPLRQWSTLHDGNGSRDHPRSLQESQTPRYAYSHESHRPKTCSSRSGSSRLPTTPEGVETLSPFSSEYLGRSPTDPSILTANRVQRHDAQFGPLSLQDSQGTADYHRHPSSSSVPVPVHVHTRARNGNRQPPSLSGSSSVSTTARSPVSLPPLAQWYGVGLSQPRMERSSVSPPHTAVRDGFSQPSTSLGYWGPSARDFEQLSSTWLPDGHSMSQGGLGQPVTGRGQSIPGRYASQSHLPQSGNTRSKRPGSASHFRELQSAATSDNINQMGLEDPSASERLTRAGREWSRSRNSLGSMEDLRAAGPAIRKKLTSFLRSLRSSPGNHELRAAADQLFKYLSKGKGFSVIRIAARFQLGQTTYRNNVDNFLTLMKLVLEGNQPQIVAEALFGICEFELRSWYEEAIVEPAFGTLL
ncbi:hypothetical protein EOPP23_01710 [Endozoicomonas sp. OPT23]|uniref:hypothetical protein n=1 Tax=Endozoicomonas sp. OPT23 TaxID=2072845 RepID=UPI00129BA0DB|nr:hypothetical protein [Endozoicomonas sp. OPT23]MRI31711.1 hypothetical protein [Endozoicomonas sp. OPT23]